MDTRIKECLENKQESYILPFMWLHGEPKERIYEEILAIKKSGIKEFCAESRPYEKFCQDEWWEDFEYILETAKKLDMGVWLLDDRAFPTGYANGFLGKPENAHLRKQLIREFQIEAIGPMGFAKFNLGGRVRKDQEHILNVVAYRYSDETGESLDPKTAIDLTDKLDGGMIYWNIPAGIWRICVTVSTMVFEHEKDRFFYYIDMLSESSCHAMIDAIYQPHYDRFKQYFGNTFKGFFSDEPGFLNVLDTYKNKLGIINSAYPFSEELPKLIAQSAGITTKEAWLYLPALWEDMGQVSSLMRAHYMEVATELYRKNFSYQLGDWCRNHGVMYIGHVIEDMGAHTRLGYGSGHYFRALDGQDMGGIDIVLHQDIPGILGNIHRGPLADGGATDPAFFHYTLPKLAASHSHIQPLKKGRAMCEIFGAFGWAEGLPFMKGLADLMLSCGINYFVPHAFTPKSEDPDCPPHFYNGGKNPQFILFRNLIEYMGRCSHVITDGLHKSDVAVFYNAEGEWSSDNNYEEFSALCRELTRGMIDFDIVPYDSLKDARIENGRLYINEEDYGALIVSGSEKMMLSRIEEFSRLAKQTLPVIFTDYMPSVSAEGDDISKYLKDFVLVESKNLSSALRQRGFCQIAACLGNCSSLRFYHITREGQDIYLFSNESINENINATLKLKQEGECLIYEPWNNKCYKSEAPKGHLNLQLEKGNMLFVVFGTDIPSGTPHIKQEIERVPLNIPFDISIVDENDDLDDIKKIAEGSELFDITASDKYPDFSGTVFYEGTFIAKEGFDVIDLGQVGEVCDVYLNGKHLGTRINAPYKFDMREALLDGENRLDIMVISNLGHRRRDYLSTFIQIPPTGLLGDIYLCRY